MYILIRVLDILWLLIIVDVLLSYVQAPSQIPRRWTHQATEPLYAPLRGLIPPIGGFDLTPMILVIGIALIRRVLVGV